MSEVIIRAVEVTEIDSQQDDTRVFKVIAGIAKRGDAEYLKNRRFEIIKAIGIMPNDSISPEDQRLFAKTWHVIPEQWKDEYRHAEEFTVKIQYK